MEESVPMAEDTRPPPEQVFKETELVANKPPDGGARAWFVMMGSFLCNGILLGIINSFGVIHTYLQKSLNEAGDADASSKAALVGSLAIGGMFFLSFVAGMLTDRLGLRCITLLGGILATSGMLLSSFVSHSIECLYFTYGLMFGVGAALAYTPSLAILGHYFRRYLGLVNGIVTAGSSVFTVVLPVLLDYVLTNHGLVVTLRVLAFLSSFIIWCALLFKPQTTIEKVSHKQDCASLMKSFVNVDNWKRKKYVIWALAIPSALFGYFVPYVHMPKFIEVTFGFKSNLPVMCIAITSGIGRLVFGYIADLPGVDRILLQQISFYSIGILSMCLPFANYYGLLLTIALGMGLFDGCFISLLGPIAFDLCGQKGGAQAIGFLLGLCSIPLTLGPPLAGMLYDHTKSYTLPFLLAGVPPLVGATIMFLIRLAKDPPMEEKNGHEAILTTNAWKDDIEYSDKRNGSHLPEAVPLAALVSPDSTKENGTLNTQVH
ncbi:monocarboxylate transporter 10-like protein kar isoform X2 [Arctopsyche grandis]|uniref:monocarboxylate transporter 10-like protein kar isoform X2 n=1 Tax=Arctopsyche grandis TaxID=121162 RepID=UPI00406D7264